MRTRAVTFFVLFCLFLSSFSPDLTSFISSSSLLPVFSFLPVKSISALASSSAAVKKNREKLEENLDAQEDKSARAQEKISALVGRIKEANEEIAETAAAIEEAKAEIDSLGKEIDDTEREIQNLEEDKQDLHDDIKESIGVMYRLRMEHENPVAVYLKSGSLSEYINHLTYVKAYIDTFDKHLERYESTLELDEDNRSMLVNLQNSQKKEKASYEKAQASLEKKIAALGKDMKAAKKEAKNADQAAAALKKEIQKMKQEEVRLAEEEAARLAALNSSGVAAGSGGTYGGGGISNSGNTDTSSSYSQNFITDGNEYFSVAAYSPSDSDFALLSSIIQAEAGNQTYAGKVAVGSVVMNRLASNRFPNTIPGVLYAPGQFYPAGQGRLATILAEGAREDCKQVARDVFAGKRNVTKFYFQTVAYCQSHGIHGIQIGNHVFH